jgi:hypothetical protein
MVEGCTTYDSADFIANVQNIWRAHFHDNIHNDVGGDGYIVGANGGIYIVNNFIEGYGASGTFNNAIEIGAGLPRCEVHGNVIGTIGAPTGYVLMRVARRINITNNQFLQGGLANTGCLQLNLFADHCTISGNLFDNFTNYGVQCNGGANYARIENNSFTGGDYGSYAVRIYGAVEAAVVGNLIQDCDGGGINVHDAGVGSNGENCDISCNVLRGVRASAITGGIHGISITPTAGGCRACTIGLNNLYDIGEDAAYPTPIHYGIYTEAEGTLIIGNSIRAMTGYSGVGGVAVGIQQDNEGSMVGNLFSYNITGGQVAETMHAFGIANGAAGPNVCNGNYAYIRGTNAAGAGKTTRGFYFGSSEKISVAGNVIGDWTHTGANNLAMEATGTQNLFVANYDASANGVSISTSKPSQVAYLGNGATPRADMNTTFGAGF